MVVTAVALALSSGCSTSTQAVSPPAAQPSGSTAHALTLWADFPATSSPRPLVLAGPTVTDPATGFPTGDDKLAYGAGRFVLRSPLPGRSATWEQQPLITAAQAMAQLRGQPQGGSPTAAPLVVTNVRLGTATFSTDRGQQRLPAWLFTFAHVRDPAAVLAVAAANRWPQSVPAGAIADLSATIAPGGRTVTITFVGAAAGTGPCTAQYEADTAQSNTAVVISIRPVHASDNGPTATCTAMGYQRVVTVPLAPALGGRALIDSHGAPIPGG